MKVGIDLVEVKRFAKIAANINNDNNIFTENEKEYILSKIGKNIVESEKKFKPYEYTIAGLYAGKEAVLKAIGVGINNGIALKDVEIGHDNNGACIVNLHENAKNFATEHGFNAFELNITHDGEYANAICIAF